MSSQAHAAIEKNAELCHQTGLQRKDADSPSQKCQGKTTVPMHPGQCQGKITALMHSQEFQGKITVLMHS
jgi:hypothetical protein